MNPKYFIFAGAVISCFVTIKIIVSFLNTSCVRTYESKKPYILWQTLMMIFTVITNCINIPALNLVTWLTFCGLGGVLLYHNRKRSKIVLVLQIIAFIIILTTCESIGVVVTSAALKLLKITVEYNETVTMLYMIVSKIFVIALYRLAVVRILTREKMDSLQVRQYLVYVIVTIFSLLNFSTLFFFAQTINENKNGMMLLLNGVLLLLLNLYIGDLLNYLSENNRLKSRLQLSEQRNKMQEEHYMALEERYRISLKVLHDVNKHIQLIENFYKQDERELALSYTKEINQILTPLLPEKYCENHTLNTILNDKIMLAKMKRIAFITRIGSLDLNFMQNTDITTIFCNLIDNAIEECETLTSEKEIEFFADTHNEVIIFRIENTCAERENLAFQKLPESTKGEGHGIGLGNVKEVLNNYHGDIILEQKDNHFICNIMINRN